MAGLEEAYTLPIVPTRDWHDVTRRLRRGAYPETAVLILTVCTGDPGSGTTIVSAEPHTVSSVPEKTVVEPELRSTSSTLVTNGAAYVSWITMRLTSMSWSKETSSHSALLEDELGIHAL